MKFSTMKKQISLFLLIAALLPVLPLSAQPKAGLDQSLADSLHGHGSMNVVFAVIAIILGGLFIFLWRTDKKVSKLEKEINSK